MKPAEHLTRDIRRRTCGEGALSLCDSARRLKGVVFLEQPEDGWCRKEFINTASLAALFASAKDNS